MSAAMPAEAQRIVAEGLALGVDLSKSPPCAFNAEPRCKAPATWRGRHVCCGFSALLCTVHKDRALKEIEILRASTDHLQCAHCGALPMPDPDVHPI